jgi:peptidoglycan hydrolase-like protein with peptidoglycan-binding domain
LRLPARRTFAITATLALFAGYAPAQPQTKPPASSTQQAAKGQPAKGQRRHGKRKKSWKRHGQQGMQPDRVLEIQQALVREKYLAGEPSGKWDARTQEAMTRYQTSNGWQSKVTPDSRALIKLGLGPNYSDKDMLNLSPNSAAGAVAANSSSAASSAASASKR